MAPLSSTPFNNLVLTLQDLLASSSPRRENPEYFRSLATVIATVACTALSETPLEQLSSPKKFDPIFAISKFTPFDDPSEAPFVQMVPLTPEQREAELLENIRASSGIQLKPTEDKLPDDQPIFSRSSSSKRAADVHPLNGRLYHITDGVTTTGFTQRMTAAQRARLLSTARSALSIALPILGLSSLAGFSSLHRPNPVFFRLEGSPSEHPRPAESVPQHVVTPESVFQRFREIEEQRRPALPTWNLGNMGAGGILMIPLPSVMGAGGILSPSMIPLPSVMGAGGILSPSMIPLPSVDREEAILRSMMRIPEGQETYTHLVERYNTRRYEQAVESNEDGKLYLREVLNDHMGKLTEEAQVELQKQIDETDPELIDALPRLALTKLLASSVEKKDTPSFIHPHLEALQALKTLPADSAEYKNGFDSLAIKLQEDANFIAAMRKVIRPDPPAQN